MVPELRNAPGSALEEARARPFFALMGTLWGQCTNDPAAYQPRFSLPSIQCWATWITAQLQAPVPLPRCLRRC